MAVIMLNAASMAYRKASAMTRDKAKTDPDIAPWLAYIASQVEEDQSEFAPKALIESSHHRKERLFSESKDQFERMAWFIHQNITSTTWFELFVMFNIVCVGITTGLDLENQGRDKWTVSLSHHVEYISLGVFTLEGILKLISEAYEPWRYFTNIEFGNYNTFDFVIVFFSYMFLQSGGGAISTLRMLRLIRLFTFIKHIRYLRVLVNGLIQGVKSATYIILLLFMIIYIFAILACNLFGANDPNHFGDIAIAMLSLAQVSTLGSWISIAYISWFGCQDYLNGGYDNENPSRIQTIGGNFEGFKCHTNIPGNALAGVFWPAYILLTTWVVMSLFIGVISSGMFETYMFMEFEHKSNEYIRKHAENTKSESELREEFNNKPKSIKNKIDLIFEDNIFKYSHKKKYLFLNSKWSLKYYQFVLLVRKIKLSAWFTILITFTILIVGCLAGMQTNDVMKCQRLYDRLKRRNQHDEYKDDEKEDEISIKYHQCELLPSYLFLIALVSQVIFTFEACIKIISYETKPFHYFIDKEEGAWNSLDFFIVIVGFLEYTQAKYVFEAFPVVLLRLLRLLRVFRLAKTLPRLRSIVEALISAFSTVGWICLLLAVFTYIVACMCMIVFQENDPFHFGSVGRSMFSIFRIETLDVGDIILYVNVFGCDGFPLGYPFMREADNNNDNRSSRESIQCHQSKAFGWYGAFLLFTITIIGAYVLPIVLIGVVSIQFNKANAHYAILQDYQKGLSKHLKLAREAFPGFLSNERVELIEEVFNILDANDEKSLDMNNISPFIYYIFDHLFEIQLSTSQFESVFYVADITLNSEIGIGEFIQMIRVLKQIHSESMYKDKEFARNFKHRKTSFQIIYNGKVLDGEKDMKKKKIKTKRTSSLLTSAVSSLLMTEETKESEEPSSLASRHSSSNSSLTDDISNTSNDCLLLDNKVGRHEGGVDPKRTKKEPHLISNKIFSEDTETTVNNSSNGDADIKSEIVGKKRRGGKSKGIINPQKYEVWMASDYVSKWDNAMMRVDQSELDAAWDGIIHSVNALEGESLMDKTIKLYDIIDSGHSGQLSFIDLSIGLKACGVRLNDRQIRALIRTMDLDGNGSISLEEFVTHFNEIKHTRATLLDNEEFDKVHHEVLRTEGFEAGQRLVMRRRKYEMKQKQRKRGSFINGGQGQEEEGGGGDSTIPSSSSLLKYHPHEKESLIAQRYNLSAELERLKKEVKKYEHHMGEHVLLTEMPIYKDMVDVLFHNHSSFHIPTHLRSASQHPHPTTTSAILSTSSSTTTTPSVSTAIKKKSTRSIQYESIPEGEESLSLVKEQSLTPNSLPPSFTIPAQLLGDDDETTSSNSHPTTQKEDVGLLQSSSRKRSVAVKREDSLDSITSMGGLTGIAQNQSDSVQFLGSSLDGCSTNHNLSFSSSSNQLESKLKPSYDFVRRVPKHPIEATSSHLSSTPQSKKRGKSKTTRILPRRHRVLSKENEQREEESNSTISPRKEDIDGKTNNSASSPSSSTGPHIPGRVNSTNVNSLDVEDI